MTSSHRRAYVDWARGIAVLLMIEAHTSDAWTRLSPTGAADDRVSRRHRARRIRGAAVSLARRPRRRARRDAHGASAPAAARAAVEMICRRGLEIFILGFLFRLQGFIITPGSHPVTLFRVDILNIMGPAIAVAGIVWGLARTTAARVACYAVIATAIAMVTPIVRIAPAVDALPMWVQWYVRPFNEFTIFTLFPWAGFVFAGGAVGALIAASRDEREERRLQTHPRRDRRGADRDRLRHRGAAVDLRGLVVLDQLADLVRDPRRHPDGRADGDLLRRRRVSRARRSRSWAAARCSSTGSTSSWSTATPAGCGVTGCRCGARRSPTCCSAT